MAEGNTVAKIGMWVGIGLVVVVAEIGLSYFVVNQLMAGRLGSTGAGQEAVQGDSLATGQAAANRIQQAEQPSMALRDSGDGAPIHAMGDEEFTIEGTYSLSDFVINPAYSQGKHFFVSSMVFAFKDKAQVTRIQEREPVLQDRIIQSLSKQTFAWFGENTNREILRKELARIACEVLGIDGGVKIYFTKYVLQ